jgi:hypothetical protein
MTEKKISLALSRIKKYKAERRPLEALLSTYYLNLDLIKFILTKASPGYKFEGKKLKEILKDCHEQALSNTVLKPIIAKRSIKSCKSWSLKMDTFFKSLKLEFPANISSLLAESETICGILKISASKLLVKK